MAGTDQQATPSRRALLGAAFAISLAALACPKAQATTATEQTRQAQETLRSLGYHLGKADGIAGPHTRNAVRAFQHRYGLPETGELDRVTLAALSVPAESSQPTSVPKPTVVSPHEDDHAGSAAWIWYLLGLGALGFYIRSWRRQTSKPARGAVAPTLDASPREKIDLPASAPVSHAQAPECPAPQPGQQKPFGINMRPDAANRPAPSVDQGASRPSPGHDTRPDVRMTVSGAKLVSQDSGGRPIADHSPQNLPPIQSPASRQEIRPPISQARPFSKAVGTRWFAGTEQIEIAGHILSKGFIYVGRRLAKQSGYGDENCLIDPTLRVAAANPDADGTSLPYWPAYKDLSPQARLAYLNWLSGGRDEPDTYIGYVFLYFYGLERRLFAHSPGAEMLAIVAEVRRLLSVYGGNHSFRRYATALLDAASLVYDLSLQPPPLTLRKSSWSVPLPVRVAIGKLIADGKGISADWALAWYTTAQDRRLPVIATRCEQEFVELFRRRFDERFPQGLKASTKKRLSGQYHAASGTFSVQLRGAFEKLPDVGELKGPLNQCEPIVESCVRDLTDYARLIGKSGTHRGSVIAAVALPKDLQDSQSTAPKGALAKFLDTKIAAEQGVLTLKSLLEKVDPEFAAEEKVTKRNLEMVAAALSQCGFGFEPDPRLASGSRATADEIVVFREAAGVAQAECRPEYLAALALADVGALIAAADGVFSPDERTAFEAEIEAHAHLMRHERARLRARFEIYARTPPSTRILNRFKEAPLAQREAIARLAVTIATADGNVAVEEMRTLEKLYKTLSLPQERLYADVHALRQDEDLPTVSHAEPQNSVPIPEPAGRKSSAPQLNSARLAKIRADTAIVTSILGDIFEDDSPQAEPNVSAARGGADTAQSAKFDGLDPDHAALVADLLGADHLSVAAFSDLAAKHGLLAEGAMEVINDWAYDRFGDPMLDEDNGISIDRELLTAEQAEVA